VSEHCHSFRLDGAALEPVVQRALGSTSAEVLTWRAKPLGGGFGATLGAGILHRVSGTAEDHGNNRQWSLVRKRLRPPVATSTGFSLSVTDPGNQRYWKREAHVYASDLLQDLPAGFAAPRSYGIDEREDGIVLWLEDVAESNALRWSMERYGIAARHLGRFNGAYLVGRRLPDVPWLCRDMDHWREAVVAPFWDTLADRRNDPRVQRGWPGDFADRAHQLWKERGDFFAALEHLPQVLSHGDTDRRNLLERVGVNGVAETVAIDWAFLGPQAVGTDAATLVVLSVLWARDREPHELPALSRQCFEGYLTGLREMGWTGAERLVRLGYAAVLSLRFVALTGPILAALAGEDERPRLEAAFGTTLESVLDRHAAMHPFLLELADETRSLLASA
jgi:hypothetical protein